MYSTVYFILFSRRILKHPLVKLFIALKWRQFNKLYLIDLLFSFLMTSCLTAYILLLFSGITTRARGVFGDELCPESSNSSNLTLIEGECLSKYRVILAH